MNDIDQPNTIITYHQLYHEKHINPIILNSYDSSYSQWMFLSNTYYYF